MTVDHPDYLSVTKEVVITRDRRSAMLDFALTRVGDPLPSENRESADAKPDSATVSSLFTILVLPLISLILFH